MGQQVSLESGNRNAEGSETEHTTCSVEEAVSSLDGVVHGISASRSVDLPEAESDLWHLVAAVELDGRNHGGICAMVPTIQERRRFPNRMGEDTRNDNKQAKENKY